jgi:preprotein translocase subunit SecG
VLIYLLNALWLITSIFLILVVLIQRGRGGGLAGAFGGAGGSSAFGTRAGDVMTKITVGVFVVWIVLCLSLIMLMTPELSYTGGSQAGKTEQAPGAGTENPFSDGAAPVIPSPPPVDKAAGAAEKKDDAAKKESSKAEAVKSEAKAAAPAEKPAQKTEPAPKAEPAPPKAAQPAPKGAEPAPKAAEPATKKQG